MMQLKGAAALLATALTFVHGVASFGIGELGEGIERRDAGDIERRHLVEFDRRATTTGSACAVASSAVASWVSKYGTKGTVYIPADTAYNCLKTVPCYQTQALALIASFKPFINIQSDLEYLASPPTGYLLNPTDLLNEFDRIESAVKRNAYASEYDFQIDIKSTLNKAHNGHLYWSGDLSSSVFRFERSGSNIAQISVDGISPPQIYAVDDLIKIGATKLIPNTAYKASPIVSINGQDVVTYLLGISAYSSSQDPDAMYNDVIFSLPQTAKGNLPLFEVNGFYQGPTTIMKFANGTTVTTNNVARVLGSLSGITSGEDMYKRFCSGQTRSKAKREALPASSTTSSVAFPTGSPTIPYHPKPVIKQADNAIAGYYLDADGLKDTAVLQILSFASDEHPQTFEKEFQQVVQRFFAQCVTDGKKKLIIDLQGNPGGYIDLGTDTFAQLFPTIKPNSKSNMRGSIGMEIVTKIASANVTAAELTVNKQDELDAENIWTPFAYQTITDEKGNDYKDLKTFYGPYTKAGGIFTNFFQNNYTDPNSSDFDGDGIIITGTNDRLGFKQPFTADNIIVLTDGGCASTCTVFSEYLKNYCGIQFITIGGRPQEGPMQAIGGVKGSQIFNSYHFLTMLQAWYSPQNTYINQAANSVWQYFTSNFIQRSRAQGCNGRNSFRQGDTTETPLQFVYEAADCRLWYTLEMLYDPVFLWNRVGNVAFKDRSGTKMTSKYCVAGSTGHVTSISGGWQKGTLGVQTPPSNARFTTNGWKLTGQTLGAQKTNDVEKVNDTDDKNSEINTPALESMIDACEGYDGSDWLVKLFCNALG